jgi:hypothetical protein
MKPCAKLRDSARDCFSLKKPRGISPRRRCGCLACTLGEAVIPNIQPVSTSFKVLPGALIERWNSRIRGTISFRKREPLNTP